MVAESAAMASEQPLVEASQAVDMSLGQAQKQAQQLEAHVRVLNSHFDRAQERVTEIGKLCDEAEASVKRSQSLLNRSAREMHTLNERTKHLLNGGYGAGGETPEASRL